MEFSASTNITTTECATCGILYAMPSNFASQRRADGETFWCPNGHKNHYEITTEFKLSQAEIKLNIARNERDTAERKLKIWIGKYEKLKTELEQIRTDKANEDT